MPKLTLDLDAIAVESFDAAPACLAVADLARTGQRCSAVDACPTRLCDTSLC
jgi:hypothetical protein